MRLFYGAYTNDFNVHKMMLFYGKNKSTHDGECCTFSCSLPKIEIDELNSTVWECVRFIRLANHFYCLLIRFDSKYNRARSLLSCINYNTVM